MTLSQYLNWTHMTASQFAEKCGVTISTITRLSSLEHEPGLSLALKIRRLTDGNVTLEEMLMADSAKANRRRKKALQGDQPEWRDWIES